MYKSFLQFKKILYNRVLTKKYIKNIFMNIFQLIFSLVCRN